MREYLKAGLVIVLLVAIGFGLVEGGIAVYGYFAPKTENVKRKVFEQTKSYTHGKIQDLAKYFKEYTEAKTMEDKETIKTLIQSQFAEFDASNIEVVTLRQFLVNTRGY